ncbi:MULTISPECIES: alpha/beta hydrolase [Bizionia]|uniref:Alpha/beta hydrolase n=1 Tax=Bizionia algoritergicola TaxID=291187 RepID=A0A5D0QVI9_9FLAO|nr:MULTISPECIES: alpha/beta hydrolase [Bizionia]OBX22976.1 alpha/beta hydrolase [Bizionia sp. APA-3]TYB72711.1 alpha/beta hydrolase [Bizionia algoritergicola]
MKLFLSILALSFTFQTIAQEPTTIQTEIEVSPFVDGSLLEPTDARKNILAIIIGDYGPTDRNGNQNFQKNNNLKKIAYSLAENGISSFRYDKRIVKQILKGRVNARLTFDDYIKDAKDVVNYFVKKNNYASIYIIGHGQGSLIGMLATDENVAGLISLGGSAKSIDQVILEQIEQTAPGLKPDAERVFNVLKTGKTTTDFPQALSNIFSLDTQDFMGNWMQYHPVEIIKTLNSPVLIINGTKDLQVSTAEAQELQDAAKQGTLKNITNMNHVLFIIEGGDLENSKSYNESFRPLAPELVEALTTFIK